MKNGSCAVLVMRVQGNIQIDLILNAEMSHRVFKKHLYIYIRMCFICKDHEDFCISEYMLCLISHLAHQIQKADTLKMENKDQCACNHSLHATANGKMVVSVVESLAN